MGEEHMHVINSLFVLQFVTTHVQDSDITVYPQSGGITLMPIDIKLLGRKQKLDCGWITFDCLNRTALKAWENKIKKIAKQKNP